jgi:DNA mismatch repair protein MutS
MELEQNLLSASDEVLQKEKHLVESLIQEIIAHTEPLRGIVQTLSLLDVSSALAELAVQSQYIRPVLDDSKTFRITGGRHPVVERLQSVPFVKNNCILHEEETCWLLTGPNMAGKSTFLRQNALIALMAHMGSFVPASSAHIGIVDRIFSRVGASDDLARGYSTFMVEMIETASILNQATDKSLVILDEVGRGTATYDGLSLAWACIEHLLEPLQCRTLFATHYHELAALSGLKGLAFYTLKVKEWEKNIVFLHEIVPGVADRSYGLHVARLAGIPESVLHRAETILKSLEAPGKKAQ